MLFKELLQNNVVHVIDKADGVAYHKAVVVEVGKPYFPTDLKAVKSPSSLVQMVDVTLAIDGQNVKYSIPDNLTQTAAPNSVFLYTSIDDALREIESTKAAAVAALAATDKQKKTVEQCDNLLGELDTAFKEKKLMEQRMASLEKSQNSILDKLDALLMKKGGAG